MMKRMTQNTPSGRQQQGTGLTEAHRIRGMRLAYLSQMFGAHLTLFLGASAICPLFIKKLGGSDLQAMLPATMTGLLMLIQIPVSILVPPARGRNMLLICWGVSSLPMAIVLLAVAGFGAQPITVWIVLVSLVMTQLFLSAGSTFWWPLLYDVVPSCQLGRFFGKLRAIWSLTYFGLSVLAGIFLGQFPALWQFLVVLGVVTGMQMLRELFVARMPVRLESDIDRAPWMDEVRYIFGHRKILMFGGYFMFLMFLAGFLGQPLVLYMNDMGFSPRDNTLIYAASVLGSVLALIMAGIILDRTGTRRMFLGVHVILSIIALAIALVGELPVSWAKPLMTLILIMSGAALAVAGLANTAQIFHMAPASGKTLYMSIMVTASAAGAAVSPFLSGLILDSSWRQATLVMGAMVLDVYQILFLVAGLGLVLAMAFLPFIQDVRSSSRIDPLQGA